MPYGIILLVWVPIYTFCNLPPLQKSLVYTCGWHFCWYNVAVEDYVTDHSEIFLSMAFRSRKNKYCQVYSKSPKQTGIYKEFNLLLPCKRTYQVDNIVLFIVMCFSLSESNSYYMATMNYPKIALMLKMGLSIIHSYVGKMI